MKLKDIKTSIMVIAMASATTALAQSSLLRHENQIDAIIQDMSLEEKIAMLHGNISGGYSQTLTGTTPVGDLSIGISFKLFDNYDIQMGIDFLHFQIAPTDRFQTVSDESLIQLPSLILALPFAYSAPSPYCMSSRCGLHGISRYMRIMEVIGFLLHGSLYFPVVPNNYFGFINKHRFLTEIITKGWHKESFTFQDDIGLRLLIKLERIYGFFIDGGIRFEKNFSRDLEKKWFVQAGLTSGKI